MQFLRRTNRTALALCLNAFVLLLILLAITTRDGRLFSGSPAFGQMNSTQSGQGVVVMPGQLSANTWGCFVVDNSNQPLSVYQFSPSDHNLKLAAARDIQY